MSTEKKPTEDKNTPVPETAEPGSVEASSFEPTEPDPPVTVDAESTVVESAAPEEASEPAKESAAEPVAEPVAEVVMEAAEDSASEPAAEKAAEAPAESPAEAKATSESKPEAKSEPSPEDEAKRKAKEEAAAAAMAAALAQDERLGVKLKKGQRVEVKLAQVGDKQCFLDYGGHSEGSIATAELKNDEGELRVKEGEKFTVIVKAIDDVVEFTVGRGKGGDTLRLRELEQAHENGIPVQGTVRSTNKGGFEIQLQGVRGFCPFSQIDVAYCDRPEDFVGQSFPFQIIAFERGGRNIVLSRRKLIEADAKEAAVKTRDSLEVGAVLEGTVRRLQPYGAFIDVGGIDGLVHVSEISHGHVRDPKELLKVGQAVKVKVIRLENLGTKQERISLSMKEFESDPWSETTDKLEPGKTVTGKVVRLTEFGAFVELAPGLDGLVHVSEISSERIDHPQDVLKSGQEVEVRILSIDPDSRRISLSMRPEGDDAGRAPRRSGGRPPREREDTTHYVARPEEPKQKAPDVSNMEYDDALALLKQKFNQD